MSNHEPDQPPYNTPPTLLGRIYSALVHTENWILAVILVSMLMVAVLQIVLRNFFGSGIVWAEALVRILVLWIALIGAMVATRNNKHINIDVLTRFLPWKSKLVVMGLVNLFTAGVCGIMGYSSIHFVYLEYQDGTLAFAHVPNWLCESIFPIAFLIMALRYSIAFIGDVINLTNNKKPA
jgi:TRAP-type C4-dicarboxylate transport system permease small subunit